MSTQKTTPLGRRMAKAREDAGYPSVARFADATGLSYWSVRRWEKGEAAPRLNHLADFARATGVSVEWLMTGASEAAE